MSELENLEKDKNIKLKRINSSYLIHEIKHLLHFENGFLFTVKELLVRPGKTVRNFILEDRSKITKPIIFLIFSATLFTLVFHFFHIEYTFFSLKEKVGNIDPYLSKDGIEDWINSHIGYASIGIGFLIAFWLSIFFKKQNYNIYEITILLCYSIGEALLIILVFSLFSISINSILNQFGVNYKDYIIPMIGVFASYFYIFWSIGQFFGEKKIMNYVKSVTCCFLGVFSFRFLLILIAYIFYLVKH